MVFSHWNKEGSCKRYNGPAHLRQSEERAAGVRCSGLLGRYFGMRSVPLTNMRLSSVIRT